MSGDFHGRGGPLQSVHHTEMVVSACVRTGAQPLLDGYGESEVLPPETLSEVGATPPWPASGSTRGPGQGGLRGPIRGGGGGRSLPPTPTQGGRAHPPPHGTL